MRSAAAYAALGVRTEHIAAAAAAAAADERSNLPQGDDENATAGVGQRPMDDRRPAEVQPWLVQLRAKASLPGRVLGQERHWLRRSQHCQHQQPCSWCCSASESAPVERRCERLRSHQTTWTPKTWSDRSHPC